MGVIAILFGLLSAIIWIIIGWRAMRAHEQIAEQITRYLEDAYPGDAQNMRRENAAQHKHYRRFILQNPTAENMPPRERHDFFRVWLRTQRDPAPEE